MRLTALEIRKQDFKKVLRGYDPVEVETFLEMVADEYESLAKIKTELAEKVKLLETRIHDYEQIENTLQKTLMDAKQSVDQSKESTKREADLVIREAEVQAGQVLDDARRELSRLKNEIAMAQNQKNGFMARLKQLLRSQIELVEILEQDDTEVERTIPAATRVRESGGLQMSGARHTAGVAPRPVAAPAKPPAAAQPNPRESAPRVVRMDERPEQPRTQGARDRQIDSRSQLRGAPPKGSSNDLIDRMILEQELEEDDDTKGGIKKDNPPSRPRTDEPGM